MPPLRPQRLAIVLSRPLGPGNFSLAASIADAACQMGHDVGLFFMSAAVRDLPQHRKTLCALSEAGCDLIACASSARDAGISQPMLGITLGSQDDHAALVHRADRVVAIT